MTKQTDTALSISALDQNQPICGHCKQVECFSLGTNHPNLVDHKTYICIRVYLSNTILYDDAVDIYICRTYFRVLYIW